MRHREVGMLDAPGDNMIVAALHHDLMAKRSFATFLVEASPDKHLVLDLPFGTTLEYLEVEADKALRAFAAQLASITLKRAS
jgi:hypothetical protein